MAKIDDLLSATNAGFIAVAARRNLDVASLSEGITNADLKAETAIADATSARAAADAAAPKLSLTRSDFPSFGSPDFSNEGLYVSVSEGNDGKNFYIGFRRDNTVSPSIGDTDRGIGAVNFMTDSRTDRMQIPNSGLGLFGIGQYSRINLEGGDGITTGWTGGRIAMLGEVTVTSLPMASGYQNPFLVGVNGKVIDYIGHGGTNTGAGAKGALVGLHGIGVAKGTAKNLMIVNGAELNCVSNSQATAKHAVELNLADGWTGAVGQLRAASAIYRFADGLGDGIGKGHDIGHVWCDIGGNRPVKDDGSSVLIGGYRSPDFSTGAWNITHGMDLREFTISGAIVRGKQTELSENALHLGANAINLTVIDNASAPGPDAALILKPKGTAPLHLATGSGANVVTVGTAGLGFFGAQVPKQSVAADATDLATALTLINDLKAKLTAYGLF